MTGPVRRRLGGTDLHVYPLCLGGNVFGWTADAPTSESVLDAYVAAGGNFIDTADYYPAWVPGNVGGESETIIGDWMRKRGNRESLVVATKVAMLDGVKGLSAKSIRTGCENSLRRLGVDTIDLYYAHQDDPTVPMEETLGAFDLLVREGKVRYLGASNFTTERLSQALDTSERAGLASYSVLQNHYNLVHRGDYEGSLRDVVARHGMVSVPYFSLAKGFLTGKYRDGVTVQSVRAQGASAYLDDRGRRVLAALDAMAARHGSTVAAVALAWLAAQPTVAAPIASARNVDQLRDIVDFPNITLGADDVAALSAASL
jgi:aryl-alcohol dehydrogenase-like predicted oxidoreductase